MSAQFRRDISGRVIRPRLVSRLAERPRSGDACANVLSPLAARSLSPPAPLPLRYRQARYNSKTDNLTGTSGTNYSGISVVETGRHPGHRLTSFSPNGRPPSNRTIYQIKTFINFSSRQPFTLKKKIINKTVRYINYK